MLQFILLLTLTATIAPGQGLEATLAGFLPASDYGLAAAYDGLDSILIFGAGRNLRRATETKIFKYDINTEVVEEVGRVPGSRGMGAVGVDQQGNIYYVGGNNGNYSSYLNILKFNATHPSPVEVASLPMALNQFCAASDLGGDAIYTFGGYNVDSSTTHIFKFNTRENVVENVGDLPESLYGSAAVWHRGFAYVIGGRNSVSRTGLMDVLRFDPSTNKVTALEGVKLRHENGLFLLSAVSDGESLYVIGGNTHDKTSTHQITQLDFESNTLRELKVQNFPKALVWSTTAYVPKKGAIYTFGGITEKHELTDRIYKINLS